METNLCDEPSLSLKAKQALYGVAQEALHNTNKHAGASHMKVQLRRTNEAIILEIRGNGRGFDPARSFPDHLGLRSIQERVSYLSGRLQIESAPGQGTHLLAQVPT